MKELLPLLPRPSRYLGNEWGVVRKDPAAVRGRIALAFPDLYEVGMSYLGQKILLLGRPPNRQAVVIENPDAAQPGYQETPAYVDLCRKLRLQLEAA